MHDDAVTKDRGLRAAATIFALACAALPTGCRKTSDDFCCLTPDSCAAGGAAVLMSCTDADKPYCDDTGEFGPARTCIGDPGASPCSSPDQCTSPDRPFCIDQTCVQCEQNGDCSAAVPVCGVDTHLCEPCTAVDDCAGRAGLAICDDTTGECVECLDAGDCPGEAPVCDDQVCRGCNGDTECSSEVCFIDSGACADPDAVIYVETGGAITGSCPQDTACSTMSRAILQVTATRNIIKVRPGTYAEPVVLDGITVTIVGDDAILRTAGFDQHAIHVLGGADVTLERVTISGATPNALSPVGLRCEGATSTVRLSRSSVTGNVGGAITILGCQFSLTNNVIEGNGQTTSGVAAVTIRDIGAGSLHELAFNTITSNAVNANTVGGVECLSVVPTLVFSNNIVYANTISGTGTQVGGDVECTWRYSDIGPLGPAVPGTGNVNLDPMFVDVVDRDFHLAGNSPVRNIADPAATIDVDFDGDSRPLASGPDIGADEVVE